MPQLNFKFVQQNHIMTIFSSAIEGIAPDFQAALERELKTARNSSGELNTDLFGPNLLALNKMIAIFTTIYYSITFKNQPAHIVKLVQDLINSYSKSSKLSYVYFVTAEEDAESTIDWVPDYKDQNNTSDIAFDFDEEFDDFSSEAANNNDDFVLVSSRATPSPFAGTSTNIIADLLTANKPLADTLHLTDSMNSLSLSTPELQHNLSIGSDISLTSSNVLSLSSSIDEVLSASLLDSTDNLALSAPGFQRNLSSDSNTDLLSSSTSSNSTSLDELQKKLSLSESDLQSSTEALSKSMIERDKTFEATKPIIQNLLARRTLERYNNSPVSQPKSRFINVSRYIARKESPIPAIREERARGEYNSFVALTTEINKRYYKIEDCQKQEKNLAAINETHKKLQQEYLTMSNPPNFFATQPIASAKLANPKPSSLSQQSKFG